eukprot:357240-Chlamydomonas_euryale.AAC.8
MPCRVQARVTNRRSRGDRRWSLEPLPRRAATRCVPRLSFNEAEAGLGFRGRGSDAAAERGGRGRTGERTEVSGTRRVRRRGRGRLGLFVCGALPRGRPL